MNKKNVDKLLADLGWTNKVRGQTTTKSIHSLIDVWIRFQRKRLNINRDMCHLTNVDGGICYGFRVELGEGCHMTPVGEGEFKKGELFYLLVLDVLKLATTERIDAVKKVVSDSVGGVMGRN